ncbi:MAG: hypothetical protein KF718_16885 [Polyangiaceae bacterium]|nr:hypothetical protein [Polyangiaceae bacterium]
MTEEVECHPLFVDDGEKPPLAEPIGVIYVQRFSKGATATIDVVLAGDLEDEMSVLERYGPGQYVLIGRNLSKSKILRRATVSVDAPAGTHEDAPAAAAPAAAPQAAVPAHDRSDLLLKSVMDLSMQLVSQSEKHSIMLVKAISDLSGARLADQRDMITALGKNAGGNSGTEALEKGLELGLSMAEVMANASKDESGVEEIVKGFAQGMSAMSDMQKGAQS